MSEIKAGAFQQQQLLVPTVLSLTASVSLHSHQLCDRWGEHHQFLVFVEEKVQAGEVAVLLIRKLLFSQELGHDGLHLERHGVALMLKRIVEKKQLKLTDQDTKGQCRQ